jgi:O-antigen/teichoic acid export membrane protein
MASENNKRIARNTLMLYFRMLFIMAVSLITVRIVLKTLGVVDYGIFNVVGGIVMMFSFFSNTMASASQRFFAFELGRNDLQQLKNTFNLTITIYAIIAICALLLAETIGLWFLNTHMVIPVQRLEAANWIYQFSILSFLVTILTIPYNAAIIAHEEMKVYAFVSIIEVLLRLIIVYILIFLKYDKLKLYSILIFATTCLVNYIYKAICKSKFTECRFQFYWDKRLFRILINYSGWSAFGALAGVLNNQGINILLNLFFGPIVNTARGIAYQIGFSVNQFVMNFHTAVKPQITKYQAKGEQNEMLSLVFRSSKFSYFLLFVISMPILLETNFLLTLWLKKVPEYLILFSRLVIIIALVDSLSYALDSAASATGRIKKYQLVAVLLLMNFPISFYFLKLGFPPQITMYVAIIISIFCLFMRLKLLESLIGLSTRLYFRNVILVVFVITTVSYIIPALLMNRLEESLTRFFLVTLVSIILSLVTIYILGISKQERIFIIHTIKRQFN